MTRLFTVINLHSNHLTSLHDHVWSLFRDTTQQYNTCSDIHTAVGVVHMYFDYKIPNIYTYA
jgi:hypothetical protein